MAEIHNLILEHGRIGARDRMPEKERYLVNAAANVLEAEAIAGVTYAGFCLTSLPHRQIPDDQVWEQPSEHVSLVVSPGTLRVGGQVRRFGVPYGSRARMILFYLQTQAIQNGSPEVELGRNLSDWMRRMGIPLGGKSRDLIKEQANRLSACTLTFYYHNQRGSGFEKDSIIRSGFTFADQAFDEAQGRLWEDHVRLGETFYRALTEHPVELLEAALREIANKSLALDVYVWLAYLLKTLERNTSVEWPTLMARFGASYDEPRHFKRHFLEALKMALAVYPEARVATSRHGLLLIPSPAPVGESKIHAVRLPMPEEAA
jgi:hypothetical protein